MDGWNDGVLFLPDSDGDGDVRKGLRAAGIVDYVSYYPCLQEFPFTIRNVIGKIHVCRPVGDVNL